MRHPLKSFLSIFAMFACAGNILAENNSISPIPLSDVRITMGQFRHAQNMDKSYLMALNPDRLLAPYLKEAGLEPKAENYTNWENTGLDGHIGGHYLSALSSMYAATGDEEIARRLDYMLSELKRCQDASADGYLSGVPGGRKIWREISEGNIRAGGFSLNGGWVPLYNIHKIYAGLRDAYIHAGRKDAYDMLIALTDWMISLTSDLSDEQVQQMLISEHGGLNEVFADVAAMTGKKKYVDLARRFSHKAILVPLTEKRDDLTGKHANTQIPKVIGFKRIADVAHDSEMDSAAVYFWNNVTDKRTITIGGNSVSEHFHPVDNFERMLTHVEGPETCNTYNMLRLTKMLFESDPRPEYMDYYERALYNHILSSQNPVQGGFVYFTPMRSGHYRVYSQPQTSFWCCVGSGMENHAKYGKMIYSQRGDSLLVNLFIPSKLNWEDTEIEQITQFPYEERTTIRVTPDKDSKQFSLKLRCPGWTEPNKVTLSVNGSPQPFKVDNGYITVNRNWAKGDSVTLTLPMHLQAIGLPDGSPNYSFLYGPIVLASNLGKERMDGMYADDSRGGHIAHGPQLPLQNMPVIIGDRNDILSHIEKEDDRPMTFRLKGVQPESYEDMTLEPFNTLHECRYMVYWNVVTPDEWESRMAKLREEENAKAALKAITADMVVCGEQQPESDHFIEMHSSSAGDDSGTHWRDASGWFSYRLSPSGKKVSKLRVIFRPESGKDARITIGDKEIGLLSAPSTGHPVTVDFPIQPSLSENGSMQVRIAPCSTKKTPHIYELYLLTE